MVREFILPCMDVFVQIIRGEASNDRFRNDRMARLFPIVVSELAPSKLGGVGGDASFDLIHDSSIRPDYKGHERV